MTLWYTKEFCLKLSKVNVVDLCKTENVYQNGDIFPYPALVVFGIHFGILKTYLKLNELKYGKFAMNLLVRLEVIMDKNRFAPLQIRCEKDDIKKFELIVKYLNKSKKDSMSEIINYYYKNVIENNMGYVNDVNYKLSMIFEYVSLLVKSNKDLPPMINFDEMQTIVNSPSRFEQLIKNKIDREKML